MGRLRASESFINIWLRAKGGCGRVAVTPPQRRSDLSMQRVSKHCVDPHNVWGAQDREFGHIVLRTHASADLPADTSPLRRGALTSMWRLHRNRVMSTHRPVNIKRLFKHLGATINVWDA